MTLHRQDFGLVQSYTGGLLAPEAAPRARSFRTESTGGLPFGMGAIGADQDDHAHRQWCGNTPRYVGSGTATALITLQGYRLTTGTPVDVSAWDVAGTSYVCYPDAGPETLLAALLEAACTDAGLCGLGIAALRRLILADARLQFTLSNQNALRFPLCFGAGTLIDTLYGPRPVETLQKGDFVQTADHGPQPILWIGHRRVEAKDRFAPIRFAAGTLGNTQQLEVSQQHRMLMRGWQAECLFDEDEVLVCASDLQNDRTIYIRQGGMVDYFHLLFDAHEIISANGIPSESFHPGQAGLASLQQPQRRAFLQLFPELAASPPALARPCLTAHEGRMLADYLGL
ncbi:Hint domain-containing protein [Thioclava sp. GXIMD4215]|uniref:Hint domain-containing protein n=1 Tax=Thioclava sp. GXIMD4215 TaxID=3131928 RepID=UPI00324F0057